MSPFERDSQRIVIAGASTLLGAELKSLLEESRFAGWELRLVDEEAAAGTLTEAGGEPAVIQPVEPDTFDGARFILFAGSEGFTRANLQLALKSGAKVLDLSGLPADREAATPWFPELRGKALSFSKSAKLFSILSAPAVSSALLSLALKFFSLKSLAITHFQPVSAAGRDGIEELENQTSHLLSFQPIGKNVFDEQVAFAMLDRFGSAGRVKLSGGRDSIRSQVKQALGPFGLVPAIEWIHAPIFYGTLFSAFAELDGFATVERISAACAEAGFRMHTAADGPLGNITVAAENKVFLAQPHADPSRPGLWWFWGAADNIRVPAWNAVKLAETLAE